MLNFLTLPTDNERFQKYVKLATIIIWGVILAQIISTLTEAGIIYEAVTDSASIFGKWVSIIAGGIGALVGVAMLELVGLRIFLPYATDAILYAGERLKGLEAVLNSFIIFFASVLVVASFTLSIYGLINIVGNTLDKSEQKAKTELSKKQQAILSGVQATFSKDSLTVANRFEKQAKAEAQAFVSKIEAAKANLNRWQEKERRTGRNYVSRIENAKVKLAEVEAEQSEKIANLEAEKGKVLSDIENDTKATLDSLHAVYTTNLSDTETKFAAKEKGFNIGGIILVVVSQLFALVGIVLLRIFYKLSGIKEQPIVNDYFFRPSHRAGMRAAKRERKLQEKWQAIQEYQQQTAEPPTSIFAQIWHDRTNISNDVFKLKTEQDEEKEGAKVIPIPRRQIGFHSNVNNVSNRQPENTNTDYDPNATVTNVRESLCDNCGSQYEKKVNWQRFCKPQCKEEFHARKHNGQKFNARKFHSRKK